MFTIENAFLNAPDERLSESPPNYVVQSMIVDLYRTSAYWKSCVRMTPSVGACHATWSQFCPLSRSTMTPGSVYVLMVTPSLMLYPVLSAL